MSLQQSKDLSQVVSISEMENKVVFLMYCICYCHLACFSGKLKAIQYSQRKNYVACYEEVVFMPLEIDRRITLPYYTLPGWPIQIILFFNIDPYIMVLIKLEPVHKAIFVSADWLKTHFIWVLFIDSGFKLDIVIKLAFTQVLFEKRNIVKLHWVNKNRNTLQMQQQFLQMDVRLKCNFIRWCDINRFSHLTFSIPVLHSTVISR